MTNSRAIAAKIIEKVAYQNISLSEAFVDPELKPNDDDRGFVKEMVFGTIRFWIQLQALLKTLLEVPVKQEDKDVECLLCVGLYQLIYMSVPHYALVNETVTATRVLKKRGHRAWSIKFCAWLLKKTQISLVWVEMKVITTTFLNVLSQHITHTPIGSSIK